MEGSRFDAWTRRGVGLAATGLAGALLALSGFAGTGAKKKGKKKKKKCKKFGETCNDSNKTCCCGLDCRESQNNANGLHCCRGIGHECTPATQAECCTERCVEGFCLCKSIGQPCTEDHNCCSGNCAGTTVTLCAPAP
jgi:hypothetical protein